MTRYYLIEALRRTVKRLRTGHDYQWGHMGSCNCGYLAQELTKYSKSDIHTFAMQRYGDWNEQVQEYCPSSGFKMDEIISIMLDAGLTISDLKHLETLSDPKVLALLPPTQRSLRCNVKEDVILYLQCWTSKLEQEATNHISVEGLTKQVVVQ